jgi:hypothetical protein
MTIKTYSAFTYGHTITIDNQTMPFSENNVDELLATLKTGAYTLQSMATEMARAMNEVGTLNYVASVDRSTRKITISGDSVFYLYVTSSSLSSVSPYDLLGFTTDKSGLNTYESDVSSGSYFEPQFYLQKYVSFEDFQSANAVTVNETATGKIQVVKYGDVNRMECNITLQTNIRQSKDSVIKDDEFGEDNLRAFMRYAVTKAPIEFIPDINTPNTFTDCLLDKTQSDPKGTGFKLKELYSKGYADWWESGLLTFREIK